MASNPYSLYTKSEYRGIDRLLPKSSNNQNSRFRLNMESPRRLNQMEEEDDEEVKAIKQRLREDLIRKKKQQSK